MMIFVGSLALLILCAIRWQQLAGLRRRATEERQRRAVTLQSARQARAVPHTPLVPTVEPEATAKERWVAQAVKSNPGLTLEAAGILYERMADNDADPTSFGPEN